MRWGLLLAGIVLATPLAGAASIEGTLDVGGSIALPPATPIQSRPLALFIPDASSGTLDGILASVTVHLYERDYVSAPAPGITPALALPPSNAPTWDLHDVEMRIDPLHAGWVGLQNTEGTLTETQAKPTIIQPEHDASLGNSDTGPDAPENAWFLVQLDGASLGRQGSTWNYEGNGSIKIYGPRVTLVSRENTTTFDTGETRDANMPGQITRRWIILDFQNGAVRATDSAAMIASREATATIDGELRLESVQGNLRGALAEWRSDGGNARVEGTFDAALSSSGTRGHVLMRLTGELRSSTMTTKIVAPTGLAPTPFQLLLVGAVVVGAAGAAAIVIRARVRRAGFDPEELATLAAHAADAEDYARAAHIIERARRKSPTSQRLALDHAFFLSQAGDATRALRLLDHPLIRDDPDALLLATRLHVGAGDHASAVTTLTRALAAAPVILLDIEGDPAYDAILADQSVQAALRRARRELE